MADLALEGQIGHHADPLSRFHPPTPPPFRPKNPNHFSASGSASAHAAQEVGKGAMEDDSPATKTVKGAATGLAAGTIWGTIVATWYDVPRVERHVALPGLVRTLKMCGSYGVTFAAVGGLYIGVEQIVQSQRKKRDFVNGAIGAFVSGATVYGYRGKSIKSALIGGSSLAFTSAILDVGGNTTRVDNGKAYHAYTMEKKPEPAH
uniref:Predicted protein n=1 Tax=Hordeum vulgare subsp. vulgare TaxID=112509 RepID=F2DJV2_HORVV|nr:predicted protein [Hordeum vulgare subsp. vulgare]